VDAIRGGEARIRCVREFQDALDAGNRFIQVKRDSARPTACFRTSVVFTCDPDKNHYTCPQDKVLKHCTARTDSPMHIYRAAEGDCKASPIRQQCTRGKERSLSLPFDESTRKDVMAFQNGSLSTLAPLMKESRTAARSHETAVPVTRLKLRGLAGAAEEF
jgi:hypothetical protein